MLKSGFKIDYSFLSLSLRCQKSIYLKAHHRNYFRFETPDITIKNERINLIILLQCRFPFFILNPFWAQAQKMKNFFSIQRERLMLDWSALLMSLLQSHRCNRNGHPRAQSSRARKQYWALSAQHLTCSYFYLRPRLCASIVLLQFGSKAS